MFPYGLSGSAGSIKFAYWKNNCHCFFFPPLESSFCSLLRNPRKKSGGGLLQVSFDVVFWLLELRDYNWWVLVSWMLFFLITLKRVLLSGRVLLNIVFLMALNTLIMQFSSFLVIGIRCSILDLIALAYRIFNQIWRLLSWIKMLSIPL